MRRVLSLWQPWATLCVANDPLAGHPPKEHETRHWAPKIALPIDVAIHATKKWCGDNAWTGNDPAFRKTLTRCGFLSGPASRDAMRARDLKPLPLGAIIGIARIVAINPTSDLFGDASRHISTDDFLFGDWSLGRFAWQLAETQMLSQPIPFTGRQEPLFALDDYTAELIAKQLGQFEATA